MLISGTALIHSFTIEFSAHGERGQWALTVKAPGHIASECETEEQTPFALLDEMLASAYAACCRRFPEQAPLPKPHVAASKIKGRIASGAKR
jgi:hypothetical protein